MADHNSDIGSDGRIDILYFTSTLSISGQGAHQARTTIELSDKNEFRTAKDATTWLIMMKEELGDDWLSNKMFRIGASGLLLDIERQLFHWVTGRYAAAHELAMS